MWLHRHRNQHFLSRRRRKTNPEISVYLQSCCHATAGLSFSHKHKRISSSHSDSDRIKTCVGISQATGNMNTAVDPVGQNRSVWAQRLQVTRRRRSDLSLVGCAKSPRSLENSRLDLARREVTPQEGAMLGVPCSLRPVVAGWGSAVGLC